MLIQLSHQFNRSRRSFGVSNHFQRVLSRHHVEEVAGSASHRTLNSRHRRCGRTMQISGNQA